MELIGRVETCVLGRVFHMEKGTRGLRIGTYVNIRTLNRV